MFRFAKRHSAAAAVTTIVILGVVSVSIAQTVGEDGEAPTGATGQSGSTPSANLEEIAKASQGAVGEKPPPCPSQEIVDQLKDAGLKVGPCAPVPEGLSDEEVKEFLSQYPPIEAKSESNPAGKTNCPSVSIGAPIQGGLRLDKEFPCGPGAEIVNVAEAKGEIRDGRRCVPVTWKASADSEPTTEFVCEPGANRFLRSAGSKATSCPTISVFGEGVQGYVIEKEFPCGPGAKIVNEGNIEMRDGLRCMPVIWKPTADSEERTEWVCERGGSNEEPLP